MLNTAEKMIEKVDYFACGYCTNDLKRVFKGFNKTIVNFYAGVFLIKHKKLGYHPKISILEGVKKYVEHSRKNDRKN